MRIVKWKIFEQTSAKKLYYIGANPTADTISYYLLYIVIQSQYQF
jgi:hypothetical protein